MHPRIRIRADLTTNSTHLIRASEPLYHHPHDVNMTVGEQKMEDEEDQDSSGISLDSIPTDLRSIMRHSSSNEEDYIGRRATMPASAAAGNPRKRFLSKYLHKDLSVEEVTAIDKGVESNHPIHPGKRIVLKHT